MHKVKHLQVQLVTLRLFENGILEKLSGFADFIPGDKRIDLVENIDCSEGLHRLVSFRSPGGRQFGSEDVLFGFLACLATTHQPQNQQADDADAGCGSAIDNCVVFHERREHRALGRCLLRLFLRSACGSVRFPGRLDSRRFFRSRRVSLCRGCIGGNSFIRCLACGLALLCGFSRNIGFSLTGSGFLSRLFCCRCQVRLDETGAVPALLVETAIVILQPRKLLVLELDEFLLGFELLLEHAVPLAQLRVLFLRTQHLLAHLDQFAAH